MIFDLIIKFLEARSSLQMIMSQSPYLASAEFQPWQFKERIWRLAMIICVHLL